MLGGSPLSVTVTTQESKASGPDGHRHHVDSYTCTPEHIPITENKNKILKKNSKRKNQQGLRKEWRTRQQPGQELE